MLRSQLEGFTLELDKAAQKTEPLVPVPSRAAVMVHHAENEAMTEDDMGGAKSWCWSPSEIGMQMQPHQDMICERQHQAQTMNDIQCE